MGDMTNELRSCERCDHRNDHRGLCCSNDLVGDRMKQICCMDCEHCHDYVELYDSRILERYYCNAGSVEKRIYDPDKIIDCPNFVQFVEDI